MTSKLNIGIDFALVLKFLSGALKAGFVITRGTKQRFSAYAEVRFTFTIREHPACHHRLASTNLFMGVRPVNITVSV